MSAIPLLDEIVRAGARVSANGDVLNIKAPRSLLTPDVVERLKALKPAIMAELRKRRDGDTTTTDEQPKVESAVASNDRAETITPEPPEGDVAVDDAGAFMEPEERAGTPPMGLKEPMAKNRDRRLAAQARKQTDHDAARIARWREIFQAPVQRPLQLHKLDIERLQETALAFLDSQHAIAALRLGWSELELFGAYDFAPNTRVDVRCLVAELAWGPRKCELIGINENQAILQLPQGAEQIHPRQPSGFHYAKLLWEILRMK